MIRRSRFYLGAALLLALVLIGIGTTVNAQRSEGSVGPSGVAAQKDPNKLTATLRQEFAAQAPGAKVKYWVVLADQADTSNNIPNAQWADKGWYVYNTLRAKADSTQGPLLAQLNALKAAGKVSELTSYWIINSIIASGDLDSAETVAANPAVALVQELGTYQIYDAPASLSNEAMDVYNQARLDSVAETHWNVPFIIQHNQNEIRAPQAWAMGYDGAGITVGSMDTGTRWTHEALSARYRGNVAPPDPSNIHDYNWLDGYGTFTTPTDNNGHGSHTMGTIVGTSPNPTYGNTGTAPNAMWMTVRICATSSCDAQPILNGFQWTLAPYRVNGTQPNAALRPRISSNSWGSSACTTPDWQTALTNWVNAGIFPAFSAGNSGPGAGTVGAPASYTNSWGTGALDTSIASWVIAGFSSRGPSCFDQSIRPQAIAPGVNICSSINTSDTAYSCTYSGTSMADPHVSGAVAVLQQKNPNLTIAQYMFALTNTAFFSPTWGTRPNNNYGWGLIQLDAALNSIPSQGTPTPTITGTPPTNTPTRTATLTPVASATPCAVSNYVSTDVPRTICDLCTITSTLIIPAGAGTVADIDLTGLSATHTWISDMIVSLTSPSNTTVVLINRICGSEDNFTNITLDDQASSPIGSSCPPTPGGSFMPANALSAFNGQPASGTWTLTISDNAAADTGNLTAWGLRIGRNVCGTNTPTITGTPPTNTPTVTRTATPVCPPAAWSSSTAYPIPVLDQASAVQGSTLYSFGGVSAGVVIASSYKFDGTTWTAIAPLTSAREKASAVSDGTYLYILGGADSVGANTNTLYRYDPVANTYSTMAPFTTATWAQGAAYLAGKIYRVAGCGTNCGSFVNSVEAYTVASNTWAAAAAYPQSVGWLSVVAANGYLWGLGGNLGTETAATYRYDPAANTWADAAITDLPATRWGATAGVLNGKLIMAGGYSVGVVSNTAVSLDLSNPTGAWVTLPNMITARARNDGGVLGSALHVVGGREVGGGFNGNTDNQRYLDVPCLTPTPGTPSATTTTGPTSTATAPPQVTGTATSPPVATATATATIAPTTCPVQFQDVPNGSTFYEFIRCLACRGIVNGYPCGGPGEPCPGSFFRPNNNVTRGQVSKIVSESAGFSNAIPSTQWTFQDVPPSGTFWLWTERLSGRGIIGGYPCGGALEPCVAPGNKPYFRPNNDVTRGQLSKIVSGAAGWTETPTLQTFQDVAPGSTFYVWIERVASRGIVNGYPCGGVGEPCVAPGNKPYFRPNNNATRGQMSKIAASAFFPGCSTPVVAPAAGNPLAGNAVNGTAPKK